MNAKMTGLAVLASAAVFAGCCRCCKECGSVTVDPAKAVIVKAAKGGELAAEELAANLKEVTGVAIPVVAKAGPGQFAFVIDDRDVKDESFAWTVTATNAVFSGVAKFAVYGFLEDALGVRWPAEDIIAAPAMNPLVFAKGTVSGAPELNIRTVRYEAKRGMVEKNAVFMNRMRKGTHNGPKYGHAFTGHWKKYGKEHPEYFGMRKDGIRAPKSVKDASQLDNIAVFNAPNVHIAMCCTSTGLVAQIVKDWIAAGKPEYINLCENDVPGQDSCHCPACEALDVVPEKLDKQWMTYYADRYVYFGNKVLAAAKPYRADVKVSYYAYNATQDAPKRERPDEASVIGIVPTYFTDDYIAKYVDSWSKTGAKHYFYRPNRHHYFNVPYLPVGSARHFYEIYQYIRQKGSIGFDYDSPSRTGFFQWFQDYVLMHAMFDPSKDFAYWESHYFDAFGAGKADAMAYYRYWEKVWDERLEPNLDDIIKKGKWFNFARGLQQNLKDYYKADDFAAVEPYVAAVEAKAKTESEKRLAKELRRAHEHAKVFYTVLTHKTKENTEKLIAFRKANGFPLYTWSEQYFGDLTGVEGLLGKEKKAEK